MPGQCLQSLKKVQFQALWCKIGLSPVKSFGQ